MRPIVLVPCDVKSVEGHPFHCVGEKYVNAISHGSQVQSLLVPAIGAGQDLTSLEDATDLDGLLDLAGGLFLTGSTSNVDPIRYGVFDASKSMKRDVQRDLTVFPLLARALARRMPVLAICRGIQELNVACGGALFQAVHEQDGFEDHREKENVSREQMYAPAHEVIISQGGLLADMIDVGSIQVNSLHGQAISALGRGLRVEAVSYDGVVEAVSMESHFVLGIQWHPEWSFENNPVSQAIFTAFGDAVRKYRKTMAPTRDIEALLD